MADEIAQRLTHGLETAGQITEFITAIIRQRTLAQIAIIQDFTLGTQGNDWCYHAARYPPDQQGNANNHHKTNDSHNCDQMIRIRTNLRQRSYRHSHPAAIAQMDWRHDRLRIYTSRSPV